VRGLHLFKRIIERWVQWGMIKTGWCESVPASCWSPKASGKPMRRGSPGRTRTTQF